MSRNENKAADIMTKIGLETLQGLYMIDQVFHELEKQIRMNCNEIYPIET